MVLVGSSIASSSSIDSSAAVSGRSAAPIGTGCASGRQTPPSVVRMGGAWPPQSLSTAGPPTQLELWEGWERHGLPQGWVEGAMNVRSLCPQRVRHLWVTVVRYVFLCHTRLLRVFRSFLSGPVTPAALHFCLLVTLFSNSLDKGCWTCRFTKRSLIGSVCSPCVIPCTKELTGNALFGHRGLTITRKAREETSTQTQ